MDTGRDDPGEEGHDRGAPLPNTFRRWSAAWWCGRGRLARQSSPPQRMSQIETGSGNSREAISSCGLLVLPHALPVRAPLKVRDSGRTMKKMEEEGSQWMLEATETIHVLPAPPTPAPSSAPLPMPRASGVRMCGSFSVCLLSLLLQPFVCVCLCVPSRLSLSLVGRQVGGKIVVRWTGKVCEASHCAYVWALSFSLTFPSRSLTLTP